MKVVKQETVSASCFCDRLPGMQPHLNYIKANMLCQGQGCHTPFYMSLNYKNNFETSIALIHADASDREIPNIDVD